MSGAISRKAADEILEKLLLEPDYQHTGEDWRVGVILSQFALYELPDAQQWTSCKVKTPPEEKKSYWVQLDSGGMCECRWTNTNPFWTDLTTTWHWDIFDIPQYSKVVAWMELPEQFIEEDEMTQIYCDKCGKVIEDTEERINGQYYTLAFDDVEICKKCAKELRDIIDAYLEDSEL